MRFVALLLALLVLGLSLVPCADAQELANGVQKRIQSKPVIKSPAPLFVIVPVVQAFL
jgi:hypothetical protein